MEIITACRSIRSGDARPATGRRSGSLFHLIAALSILAVLVAGCRTIHDVTYVKAGDAHKEGKYAQALELYHSVAEKDYQYADAAQFALAEMYMKGQGAPRNPRKALRLFQRVAESDKPGFRHFGQFWLGVYYEKGIPAFLEADRIQAAEWYAKAAIDGDEPSIEALERLERYADVYVHQNKQRFQHASPGAAPGGMAAATRAFKAGDLFRAFDLYEWHAKNGNAEAQMAVASFYKHDLLGEQESELNPQLYPAWLYLAARNGNARAQFEYGHAFRNSDEFPGDDDEAEKWLRAASDQGLAEATNLLGVLYLHPFSGHRKSDPARAEERVVPVLPRVRPQARKPSPVDLFVRLSQSVFPLIVAKGREQPEVRGQGSAVAITRDLAITNCHVIEDMDAYGTKIGEKVTLFRYVGGSKKRDVCAIRAQSALSPVTQIRRYDDLKVGEQVYAIGSPRGLNNTLSEGLISGLRESDGVRYIQTSAAISPGSSGGGLFDDQGRLIGITTFQYKDSQGLNFAVAIDEALPFVTRAR